MGSSQQCHVLQVSFQTAGKEELNIPHTQEAVHDGRFTIKTSHKTTNIQITANATVSTPIYTKAELVMCHHQSPGSSQKDTLLKTLRSYAVQSETFPGLFYELVTNHLPSSEATGKGHMMLTRQGLRSTKPTAKKFANACSNISSLVPTEEICTTEEKEIHCYVVLWDNSENTVYSDLTGRLPMESYGGMNYTILHVFTN